MANITLEVTVKVNGRVFYRLKNGHPNSELENKERINTYMNSALADMQNIVVDLPVQIPTYPEKKV